MKFDSLEFVDVSEQVAVCGWRFGHLLPAEQPDDPVVFNEHTFFSARRQVTVEAFAIARLAIPMARVVPFENSLCDTNRDIHRLCDVVDRALAPHGLRLPDEDEFEVAFGNQLFPWGNEIPESAGGPDLSLTTTSLGLQFDANPLRWELVRSTLKLGDGGESTCGGYAWPAQWLCYSPCFRYKLRSSIRNWNSIDIRPVSTSSR